MENPPSVSNDDFHNFLSYNDVPGIIIPQKVCLDWERSQEPKDVRSFATFYTHETTGVALSAGPGATLGVSLAEALKFDRELMRWKKERSEPSLDSLERLRIKFVLKWPGCRYFEPYYTDFNPKGFWSAARLAHETAKVVGKFYKVFASRVDVYSPEPDWTPARIPFNKLYLLELRQVSERVFQPVLYYDAN
ncbi:hypothetical protein PHLGIDRAFT_224589 [Phlebiopsis gigantea 11061_1 CR5-6]|uniref:Uncharacterized protein n=1 Tax=Phlebiopsis gigantea (strain 11061_1 CR5-6) TaxID=745531 RepID=A0A0C3RT68_PHLG1|nr:hypothetical protein PHLGIDRAFT_224589 [Phlebiopsis gigantea 11061_1 CR5-6]